MNSSPGLRPLKGSRLYRFFGITATDGHGAPSAYLSDHQEYARRRHPYTVIGKNPDCDMFDSGCLPIAG